jgi:hypothetical protein
LIGGLLNVIIGLYTTRRKDPLKKVVSGSEERFFLTKSSGAGWELILSEKSWTHK